MKLKLPCQTQNIGDVEAPTEVKNISNKNINNNNTSETESFKHLYRKKTKWELSRLSFTMMGAEVVFSLETALISPLLLMYGMSRNHVVLLWALPPILGLFLSPLLGSLSDQCRFSWGRRRPFIIFLSVIVVFGLQLIANSYVIGKVCGDRTDDIFNFSKKLTQMDEFAEYSIPSTNSNDYFYTIVFIVVGTILVDFGTDALLNPSRAYVLDVCIADDHAKGLNISTMLAGAGGFIGYVIGSINWDNTLLHNVTGGYGRIAFTIVTILFIICIAVTTTAFRELPLSSTSTTDSKLPEFDPKENSLSLCYYLKSIVTMPKFLRVVWLTNLLCWMSHVNFYFYFTHFVGRAVFEGDPTTSPSSITYQLYEEGIRFACLALSVNCIASILFPFASNKLIDKFGMKAVYMTAIFFDAICLLLMTIYRTKLMVVIVSAVSGVVYCTSFSIPYMLVAHYHNSDKLTYKSAADKSNRGLGTDISIIGTCICAAQLLNATYMSEFMTFFGVTFAVIGTASLLGFLAFLTASQIKF